MNDLNDLSFEELMKKMNEIDEKPGSGGFRLLKVEGWKLKVENKVSLRDSFNSFSDKADFWKIQGSTSIFRI